MASQLLTIFALFSVSQGYPSLDFEEFGELEIPSNDMAEDIYLECIYKTQDIYLLHTQLTVTSPEYQAGDEARKEQIEACTRSNQAAEMMSCISDYVIEKSFHPDSQNEDFLVWSTAFANDEGCKANVSMLEMDKSCLLSKSLFDARMQLLMSSSQEKKYFRSHAAALRKVENNRIKWQCKNWS